MNKEHVKWMQNRKNSNLMMGNKMDIPILASMFNDMAENNLSTIQRKEAKEYENGYLDFHLTPYRHAYSLRRIIIYCLPKSVLDGADYKFY